MLEEKEVPGPAVLQYLEASMVEEVGCPELFILLLEEEEVALRILGQIHHYYHEFLSLEEEEDRAELVILIKRMVEMGDVPSMEMVVKVAFHRVMQAPNLVGEVAILAVAMVAMGLEESCKVGEEGVEGAITVEVVE